jgi:hypothetical protein
LGSGPHHTFIEVWPDEAEGTMLAQVKQIKVGEDNQTADVTVTVKWTITLPIKCFPIIGTEWGLSLTLKGQVTAW